MNDPHDTQSQATGHQLAEALQEIRNRALESVEALENWARPQADAASGEANATQGIDDLLDDDLGLKEKVEKCSDLRASLVRRWAVAQRTPSLAELNGLIALNEAIDRCLMESITRARSSSRRKRELFLAMLGHDLRTPLGAMVMGSEYLVARGKLTDRDRRVATRMRNSGRRMTELVNDLLDFSRCRLGDGIPIVRSHTSLAAIGREIIEEVKAAHPECELRFETRGELQGEWDSGRLGEALSNLVENAVLHGASAPVTVNLIGEENEVVVSIHNGGRAIPDGDLGRIFDPFVSCATNEGARRPRQGLGLGLYIAREIARAHGGSITVSSSAQNGTTFDVHLPRAG